MLSNFLLEEKWKTQEKLAKGAKFNISVMLDNAEKLVSKIEKKKGIEFKIAKIK